MSVRTFLLPDLGEGLTEAELVTWLVAVGDTVAVDQPVAEVETAKSLVEVPSPFAGRVAQLHGSAGQSVDVGRPLISVDTAPGASSSADGSPATGSPAVPADTAAAGLETTAAVGLVTAAVSAAEEAYRQEEKAGSGNVLIGYGTPAAGQTARRTRTPKRPTTQMPSTPPRSTQPGGPGTVQPGAVQPGGRGTVQPGGPGTVQPGGRGAMQSGAVGATQTGASGTTQPEAAGAPVRQHPRPEAPRCISPLVRRMARDAGLRLGELTGTGPDGMILRRDVQSALATGSVPGGTPAAVLAAPDSVAAPPAPAGDVDSRTGLAISGRTPVRGLRRAAAATLGRSRTEIPEATVWVDVDATALMDLRADLARGGQDVPSLLAFLARFTLAGLVRYPELNTRYVPAADMAVRSGTASNTGAGTTSNTGSDTDARGAGSAEGDAVIEAFDGINLGIAVQAPRGLMVPAVRRADSLSTRGLDSEIRRLTAAAQEGRATPAELASGTFTLNNYGVFGVDGSAAIINYPESAILGVGRIIDKPWVVDGQLAVRKMTELTLVFDHRVCDGGTAGGFLRYVADAVENPARVLADL